MHHLLHSMRNEFIEGVELLRNQPFVIEESRDDFKSIVISSAYEGVWQGLGIPCQQSSADISSEYSSIM